MNTTQVVCPHCHAANRVPSARLPEKPSCGRCHAALFSGLPVPLDDAGFERHLASSDLPLLVDFWAPWCGPCRMMAPQFEKAAAMLEPHMRLAKVDTEAQPALGQRHGIRSIPTLALFHQGKEIARMSGALQAGDIVKWARQQLP